MRTFTIATDNNITAFAAPEQAQDLVALGARTFVSEEDLRALAAQWPASRLVEIWNSFAAVAPFSELKPVTKFESRDKAVKRIWNAVQKLIPRAEERPAPVADSPVVTAAPDQEYTDSSGTGTEVAAPENGGPDGCRAGSKSQIILTMITEGATLKELATSTGWQRHSLRGFLSTAAKKHGLTIESTRTKEGERFYKLAN